MDWQDEVSRIVVLLNIAASSIEDSPEDWQEGIIIDIHIDKWTCVLMLLNISQDRQSQLLSLYDNDILIWAGLLIHMTSQDTILIVLDKNTLKWTWHEVTRKHARSPQSTCFFIFLLVIIQSWRPTDESIPWFDEEMVWGGVEEMHHIVLINTLLFSNYCYKPKSQTANQTYPPQHAFYQQNIMRNRKNRTESTSH